MNGYGCALERQGQGAERTSGWRKKEPYLVDLYQRVSNDPPRWRVRQSGRELSFPQGTYNSSPPPLFPRHLLVSLPCLPFNLALETNRAVSGHVPVSLARVRRAGDTPPSNLYIFIYSRSGRRRWLIISVCADIGIVSVKCFKIRGTRRRCIRVYRLACIEPSALR